MRILPISFGQTVKVNGSTSNAFDIARLVNDKKVSKSEKHAQQKLKDIFYDVEEGLAQVLTYTNKSGEEQVYVVSGKESKKLDKIYNKIVNSIIRAGEVLLSDSHKYQEFENIKDKQLYRYNNAKRDLALDNVTNYSINAIYNKKGTSVKDIGYKY